MNRVIKLREDFQITKPDGPAVIGKITEAKSDNGKRTITTVVEGIHAGMTRNYTFYPGTELAKSTESWLAPYAKPVLKNHNDWDGEPLGRVKDATFVTSEIDPSRECIKLTLEISDPDAIEKVLDGRYQTLSIGASAGSAKCSICGKDIIKEGFCGHWKGQKYDGKEAYWIVNEMEFDEISFVNVPADRHAQVLVPDATTQKSSAEGRGNGVEENLNTPAPENQDPQAEDIIKQIEALQSQDQPENHPAASTQESTEGDNPEAGQTQESQGEEGDNSQMEEGTDDKTGLTAVVNDLQEQLATEKATSQGLKEQLDAVQAQLDTANATIESLNGQITDLQKQLTGSQEEAANMLKQNISIATYAQHLMAERVFDLQIMLGEANSEDRANTVKELAAHKASELKVQVEGLLEKRPQRAPQTVANPGVIAPGLGDVGEGTTESTSPKPPTLADLETVVMSAFKGRKA